jgi:hypothetical protein
MANKSTHAVGCLTADCEQPKHVRLITQEIWALSPGTTGLNNAAAVQTQ